MNVLIGDDAFNRWFLRRAARSCGLDEFGGTADPEELLTMAPTADLVIFDPRIQRDASAPDLALELIRLVPRTRLIVVSPRPKELDRARRNGIVAAAKTSVLRLEGIQAAVLLALENIESEVEQPTAQYQDLDLWSPPALVGAAAGVRSEIELPFADYEWPLLIESLPSANASVVESTLVPT